MRAKSPLLWAFAGLLHDAGVCIALGTELLPLPRTFYLYTSLYSLISFLKIHPRITVSNAGSIQRVASPE